jgi:O-acetyl-ADP-ribose deacetylase (regulator of RNase III)
VFHAVTIDFGKAQLPSRDIISEIVSSCVYNADTLRVERIAFPQLGTGTGGFSREICLDTMFRALAKTLLKKLTSIRVAEIVVR